MSSMIAGLKTTYARTKQKILGSNAVVDEELNAENERMRNVEEIMLRINKRANKSIEILTEMSKLHSDITHDVQEFYDPSDAMYASASKMQSVSAATDQQKYNLTLREKNNFIRPLEDYCLQYKELKKRLDECANRKADMDRYNAELVKLQEKPNPSKIQNTEEKHRLSKQSYEELHHELMSDLPRLYADRIALFDLLLACHIKCQYEYYNNVSQAYPEVMAMIENIDETKSVTKKAITPTERSSASRNLRADPVFLGLAAPRPHAQTVSGTMTTDPVPLQKTSQPAPTTDRTYLPALNPFDNEFSPETAGVSATSSGGGVGLKSASVSGSGVVSGSVSGGGMVRGGSGNEISTSGVISGSGSGSGNSKTRAQALYDFTSDDDTELCFKKGEIITILQDSGDWWEGELNGIQGLLPSNYVKLL